MDRSNQFKDDLLKFDDQRMLDRYYYNSTSVVLSSDAEADLRREISVGLKVAMRDVILTGSSKIGFTLISKPEQRRPAFSPICETSDIDIAVISTNLFQLIWKEAKDFLDEQGPWNELSGFRKYLMSGWVRPDKLPATPDFPRSSEWFEFLRQLTSSNRFGPYKISAGVYFDEHFWEKYACNALKSARQSLENEL